MTPPDFHPIALELVQKYGQPGDVALAEKALDHGYQLGLKDATERFAKAIDKTRDEKAKANAPR